ncbi:MAG TPA: hypothetical protein VH835_02825 [Dongiaceae bacterium]
MPIHRDFCVAALALVIAISLYLFSFRDLMAAPEPAEIAEPVELYTGHL